MKKEMIAVLALGALLGACAQEAPDASSQAGSVGADKDAHGCIGSAGYAWCTRTESCERPWELAEKEGFENTPKAFKQFCDG